MLAAVEVGSQRGLLPSADGSHPEQALIVWVSMDPYGEDYDVTNVMIALLGHGMEKAVLVKAFDSPPLAVRFMLVDRTSLAALQPLEVAVAAALEDTFAPEAHGMVWPSASDLCRRAPGPLVTSEIFVQFSDLGPQFALQGDIITEGFVTAEELEDLGDDDLLAARAAGCTSSRSWAWTRCCCRCLSSPSREGPRYQRASRCVFGMWFSRSWSGRPGSDSGRRRWSVRSPEGLARRDQQHHPLRARQQHAEDRAPGARSHGSAPGAFSLQRQLLVAAWVWLQMFLRRLARLSSCFASERADRVLRIRLPCPQSEVPSLVPGFPLQRPEVRPRLLSLRRPEVLPARTPLRRHRPAQTPTSFCLASRQPWRGLGPEQPPLATQQRAPLVRLQST